MRPESARAATGRARLVCVRVPFSMVFLMAAALSASPIPFAADVTPQQRVEGQLMCYCGCSDLTVRVCTCGTADAIREEIAGRLANGETPDQVVAAFVAGHGEQMRSAPTKSGFDLVAWVTPFVVLILAGSALVVVVLRWGAVRPAPATAPDAPGAEAGRAPTPEERKALDRVRREMKEGR